MAAKKHDTAQQLKIELLNDAQEIRKRIKDFHGKVKENLAANNLNGTLCYKFEDYVDWLEFAMDMEKLKQEKLEKLEENLEKNVVNW